MTPSFSIFVIAVFAAAASAIEEPGEHKIQLGSVGAYSAHLSGVMAPDRGASVDGIPTYRFSSVVKGAPVPEMDFYRCSCSVVDNYYVPLGARTLKPVFLCRSVSYETGTVALAPEDKMAFLLYSDKLSRDVRKIHLMLGKSAYRNFLASHPVVKADLRSDDREKDEYKIVRDPLIQYDAPHRDGRQVYGYGITSTSPNGFSTVSVSGFPAVAGGNTVIWTSQPSASEGRPMPPNKADKVPADKKD